MKKILLGSMYYNKDMDIRESWDSYFMRLALMAAGRGTCLRRKVGAVLVQERSVRGTAYNGAPKRVVSCQEAGECDMRDGHCIRSVHAESNIILQTDAPDRQGSTIYCTDRPCWHCSNLIANSGIQEIVFLRSYHRDQEKTEALMQSAGILLRAYQPQGRSDLLVHEAEQILGAAATRTPLENESHSK